MAKGATRPVIAAVQGQQKVVRQLEQIVSSQNHEIETLKIKLAWLSKMAGVTQEMDAIDQRVAQLKQADVANPGQPVPDPASQAPTETTEQAATPETYDDPRRPGQTPGSVQGVPADTTDLALNPGETLPTSPYGQMVDVTAPVAGTETHVPNEQTRIETDVRVGDPMNPDTAFPWHISPNQSNGQSPASGEMAQEKSAVKVTAEDLARVRTMASIKLARLQIAAGLEQGDDLSVAAKIESDASVTDAMIARDIETLSRVQRVASAQAPRPAGVVPRTANGQRTTPSVAGGGVTRFANPSTAAAVEDSIFI